MHSTYSVRADASTETLNSEALESGSSLEEPQVALLQTMKTQFPFRVEFAPAVAQPVELESPSLDTTLETCS